MILSCVKRIYDRTGSFGDITILARTLRGSRDRRILELGLDELTTYGLLKDRTRSQIHEMIDHLESLRYLREGQDKTLELTDKAKEVLYRGQTVTMLLRKEQEQIEEMEMGKSGQKLSDDETELYDVLKELRSSLAKENRVPPFVIFSNATLADMARKKPVNLTDFKKVSGVGEIKASWYGKDFLSTIKKFMEK